MPACEIHKSLVCLHPRIAASGHVGIVCPHQFHPRQVHLLQLLEVGLPSVVLHEVVVHHLRSENLAQRGVGGITGIGHEHFLAGIDEGESDVEYALLRTDKWLNLCGGIEFNSIPSLIEIRHCLAQLGCSHRGLITMSVGAACHLAQCLYCLFRRWHVGTANGKTDDVLALGVHLCHLFQLPAEVIFAYERKPLGRLNIYIHNLNLFNFAKR